MNLPVSCFAFEPVHTTKSAANRNPTVLATLANKTKNRTRKKSARSSLWLQSGSPPTRTVYGFTLYGFIGLRSPVRAASPQSSHKHSGAPCAGTLRAHVGITEARARGGVGNPRGLREHAAGPGSARGRGSPRRRPRRGRARGRPSRALGGAAHSLPSSVDWFIGILTFN